MLLLQKAATSLKLLANGRRAELAGRMRYNHLLLRIWLHRSQPFPYRRHGVRYVCFPDHPDSRIVAASAFTDHVELAVLRRYFSRGDAFLDIGANLGTYALAAGQFVGPSGCVVAVDAGGGVLQKVAAAARQLGLGHVQTVHAAVGNTDGTATFFEGVSEGTSFIQSLKPVRGKDSVFRERSVAMFTLGTIANQHVSGMPAAVKIDIEGAEGDALESAPPPWLSADGPLWLVEINPAALHTFGCTAADVAARFAASAFEVWILPKELRDGGGEGRIRRLTADEQWIDSSYYNLLALPRGPRLSRRIARVRSLLG